MKSRNAWLEEARSFIIEWDRATGTMPTLDDVKSVLATIDKAQEIAIFHGFHSVEEYAEELYGYIEEVLADE
nr:MAG TPA: hypothetical protein [Caudoviricetes sp.]